MSLFPIYVSTCIVSEKKKEYLHNQDEIINTYGNSEVKY